MNRLDANDSQKRYLHNVAPRFQPASKISFRRWDFHPFKAFAAVAGAVPQRLRDIAPKPISQPAPFMENGANRRSSRIGKTAEGQGEEVQCANR